MAARLGNTFWVQLAESIKSASALKLLVKMLYFVQWQWLLTTQIKSRWLFSSDGIWKVYSRVCIQCFYCFWGGIVVGRGRDNLLPLCGVSRTGRVIAPKKARVIQQQKLKKVSYPSVSRPYVETSQPITLSLSAVEANSVMQAHVLGPRAIIHPPGTRR